MAERWGSNLLISRRAEGGEYIVRKKMPARCEDGLRYVELRESGCVSGRRSPAGVSGSERISWVEARPEMRGRLQWPLGRPYGPRHFAETTQPHGNRKKHRKLFTPPALGARESAGIAIAAPLCVVECRV